MLDNQWENPNDYGMENQATKIIEKAGGPSAVARVLKLHPSTVIGWRKTGFIPARHQSPLVAADIGVTPDDFFDTHPAQAQEGAAS